MNYWPAGVTNLSECHQPLFKLIEEIADKGKELARDMYGLNGWAIHHNISNMAGSIPIRRICLLVFLEYVRPMVM